MYSKFLHVASEAIVGDISVANMATNIVLK